MGRSVSPVSPEALLEILGANIRLVAAERGLALNSLADFAGFTRSHLFAVLAGDSYPNRVAREDRGGARNGAVEAAEAFVVSGSAADGDPGQSG